MFFLFTLETCSHISGCYSASSTHTDRHRDEYITCLQHEHKYINIDCVCHMKLLQLAGFIHHFYLIFILLANVFHIWIFSVCTYITFV